MAAAAGNEIKLTPSVSSEFNLTPAIQKKGDDSAIGSLLSTASTDQLPCSTLSASSTRVDSFAVLNQNDKTSDIKSLTNRKMSSADDEIFDLARLDLNDDQSWLCAAPGEARTSDDILDWLYKDLNRTDLRTRKALATRLDQILHSNKRDAQLSSSLPDSHDRFRTVTKRQSDEVASRTYKINRMAAIDKSTNDNSILRKLSYDDQLENDPYANNTTNNYNNSDITLSGKKLSLQSKTQGKEANADIDEIWFLANKQEQDLRKCMQETQLSHHQRRKVSSDHPEISHNVTLPPQRTRDYHATAARRPVVATAKLSVPKVAPSVSKNNVLNQKEIGLQKSMPNLLDVNAKPALTASCHINGLNASTYRNLDACMSSSISEKGSYSNISNNGMRCTAPSVTAAKNEFKRPTSASRLPTPRSRLPVPGGKSSLPLKLAVPVSRPSCSFGRPTRSDLSRTCTSMKDSWKEGCI